MYNKNKSGSIQNRFLCLIVNQEFPSPVSFLSPTTLPLFNLWRDFAAAPGPNLDVIHFPLPGREAGSAVMVVAVVPSLAHRCRVQHQRIGKRVFLHASALVKKLGGEEAARFVEHVLSARDFVKPLSVFAIPKEQPKNQKFLK